MFTSFQQFINQDMLSGLPIALVQVLPEFSLLCLATLVLLVDAYLPRAVSSASDETPVSNYKITFWLVNLVLVLTAFLIYAQSNCESLLTLVGQADSVTSPLVKNMVTNDGLSYILKLFMVFFVFLSFYFSDSYITHNNMFSGEFYAMGLFSLLGMMVLVSSQNMLTLYLGLELFSLPVYAMIAMQRKSQKAGEAALKYFVMGAIASGILLFGISLVYGLSGSLVLSDIAAAKTQGTVPFNFAVIFICVGIAFKFGAVPFHLWMPDVYEGAPTPATTFISAAPKLAAFGMAVRLLNEGFFVISDNWALVLQVIALASIALGNVAAIAQTSLKRLLAYSGISHMGFIILGIVAASNSEVGFSSALFYAITYSLMSLAVFGFIMMLGNGKLELLELDDYKGFYTKYPWLSLMLLMVVFSMAGVPPFVGFFAKLFVIKSLIAAGYVNSAIFAVLFTVVGAYYYLRLIWLVFFEKPVSALGEDEQHLTKNLLGEAGDLIVSSRKNAVSLVCLSVLFLGVFSQYLLNWCLAVFK